MATAGGAQRKSGGSAVFSSRAQGLRQRRLVGVKTGGT